MCKPADFKYYNGYGSLNISELHGLSKVACSLFCTVCRNRFVETASIKPQRSADVTRIIYKQVSSQGSGGVSVVGQ